MRSKWKKIYKRGGGQKKTIIALSLSPSAFFSPNSRNAPVEKRLEPAGLDALEHGLLAVRLLEEGDDGVAACHGDEDRKEKKTREKGDERK